MKRRARGSLFVSALLAALIAAGCTEEAVDTEQTAEDTEATETTETTAAESTTEAAIVVHGDTINSHTQEDAVCVVDSRFEQGHRLVFRASVVDVATNKQIEDAKVKVVLATGDEYEMVLGPHGEEATLLYTVGWDIPADFPTGTLDYKYVAEVGGKEYYYEPFNVSLSKLTIVESTAQAAAPAEEGTETEAVEGEGDA